MQPWRKKKGLMRTTPKYSTVFDPLEREVIGDLTATVSEALIARNRAWLARQIGKWPVASAFAPGAAKWSPARGLRIQPVARPASRATSLSIGAQAPSCWSRTRRWSAPSRNARWCGTAIPS